MLLETSVFSFQTCPAYDFREELHQTRPFSIQVLRDSRGCYGFSARHFRHFRRTGRFRKLIFLFVAKRAVTICKATRFVSGSPPTMWHGTTKSALCSVKTPTPSPKDRPKHFGSCLGGLGHLPELCRMGGNFPSSSEGWNRKIMGGTKWMMINIYICSIPSVRCIPL